MPAIQISEDRIEKQSKEKKKIEYTVYIHLHANQNNRFWEKTSTTHDPELAVEQACMLFYSQKYPRVEVFRKFFCEKRKRSISEPFKIFDIRGKNMEALPSLGRILPTLRKIFGSKF